MRKTALQRPLFQSVELFRWEIKRQKQSFFRRFLLSTPTSLILFFLYFSSCASLSAQTERIDSLLRVLENTTNARQRALINKDLSNSYNTVTKFKPAAQAARAAMYYFAQNDRDPINLGDALFSLSTALFGQGRYQAAFDTADLGIALFDREQLWDKKVDCVIIKGRSLTNLEKYDEAQKCFEQALQYRDELEKNAPDVLVNLLTNIGTVTKMQQKPDLALSQLLEAEKISALHQIDLPLLFGQLRLCYVELGEYADAIYWNKKGIEATRNRHDEYTMCDLIIQLGELYLDVNDKTAALETLKEGIAMAERTGSKYAMTEGRLILADLYISDHNLSGLKSVLADLEKTMKPAVLNHTSDYSYIKGVIYNFEGKIDSSIVWLHKSIEVARNIVRTELSNVLTHQADNYLVIKQYDKALALYREALLNAQKDNYKTKELTILSKMATAYEKIGNFKLALQAQRSADTLAASILQQREKTYYDLAYLNLQTRTEKNNLEHQNQLYAKEEESLQLKVGWLTTGLIALLLSIGIYFFYRQLQSQRKYATVLKKESDQKIDTLKTINAALSHDLKNPALKAKYYLGRLKEKLQPAQYQAIKPDYQLIESNIDHFYLLINKLRSLYNFENTEVSATAFEVDSVITDIKQELSPFIEKTNAQITQDDLPVLKSDKLLFRQVMMNLLHNAVKFAAIRQQPLVHIGYENRFGIHIFKIRDNGIGIPVHEQENIFKLFSSAHSREQVEGDGIGLALSKRIVEKLGGNIGVDSVPSGGAQFWVSIPAA
ncbi:MAG: ATP-binding protein [Bacteroidota bacterium]